MTSEDRETLTALLRRLVDERATGLLAVTVGHDLVVIEFADGATTRVGPRPDVLFRAGHEAADAVAAATEYDVLVELLVEAVTGGEATWAWNVEASHDLIAVPPSLVDELARRVADATEAVRAFGNTLLEPAAAVAGNGEGAKRVLPLLDGTVTLAEVSEATGVPLASVALLARDLVAAGAAVAAAVGDAPLASSWAAAPPAPTPVPDAPDAPNVPAVPADVLDAPVVDAFKDDFDDQFEPEMWVMPGDEAAPADAAEPAEAAEAAEQPAAQPEAQPVAGVDTPPAEPPATSTLTGDETGAWAETGWLDELDEEDAARAARSGGTIAPAAVEPEAPPEPSAPDEPAPKAAPTPRQRPGDVSEFLRELSRLALEEDD